MTLQRIVCYALLVAAALVFLYSLGLMTDMHDNNFYLLSEYEIEGTEIYLNMQDFNRSLTAVGIALILLVLSQFVTQTHKRRKYYVANYITVGATAVANIVAAVWALTEVFSYKAEYLLVDFESVAMWAQILGKEYTESTFWFDAAAPVFAILLAVTALSLLNLVFKIMVMKSERALLNLNREVKENA